MAQPPWKDDHARETKRTGLIPMENMKHDTNWDNASTSYYSLKFMDLIEKTILAQIEDPHQFSTVY